MQHDNDAAEVYYTRAIEADPENATNLGKFAYFLHAVRGDHHMANLHYQRAVQCGMFVCLCLYVCMCIQQICLLSIFEKRLRAEQCGMCVLIGMYV